MKESSFNCIELSTINKRKSVVYKLDLIALHNFTYQILRGNPLKHADKNAPRDDQNLTNNLSIHFSLKTSRNYEENTGNSP